MGTIFADIYPRHQELDLLGTQGQGYINFDVGPHAANTATHAVLLVYCWVLSDGTSGTAPGVIVGVRTDGETEAVATHRTEVEGTNISASDLTRNESYREIIVELSSEICEIAVTFNRASATLEHCTVWLEAYGFSG